MSRARRRAGARRAQFAGAALFAATLAAMGGALGAAALLRPAPLDPVTLCRREAAPGAHAYVLVDATDTLAPRHRKRLVAAIAQEAARLEPGDRITVAALRASDPREPAALFSKCDPGGARTVNPWLGDPAEAEALRETAFARPLAAAARRAASSPRPAAQTALTDALASIADDPDFTQARTRRLVLVSDLLEHRAGLSLYRAGADFAAWARSEDAAGRLPDFSGSSIALVILDRPDQAAAQAEAAETFWRPWLEATGAEIAGGG